MKLCMAAVFMAIATVICLAAEPFDKDKAIADYHKKRDAIAATRGPELEQEIKLRASELKQAQAGRVVKKLKTPIVRGPKGEYSFRDQETKDREIKRLEKQSQVPVRQLLELRAGSPETLSSPLAVGAIGKIGGKQSKVVQVIDGSNMLIAPFFRRGNIVNAERLTVWLSGASTDGIADDTLVATDGVYIVTGTKQYNTASSGSRTVFVVEPIQLSAKK